MGVCQIPGLSTVYNWVICTYGSRLLVSIWIIFLKEKLFHVIFVIAAEWLQYYTGQKQLLWHDIMVFLKQTGPQTQGPISSKDNGVQKDKL